ncbi:cytochrome P450 [Phanerochaete sordida]|uniref:Cytochrome P450 n=1 Tax=Phanerochaete sordida TaxID=48140 RepID=A0A9P3GE14_9APHY|nr:cytochrome P450 [Phanerochaete sordida]
MLDFHETFSVLAFALEALQLLILSWLLYNVTTVIYNIYFHPLARFPGPRLAAASEWWQAYVEVIKEESLSKKLLDLHAKYGDVVRIAPNELHFSKPSAYHEIYNVKNRWDRDMKLYRGLADEESLITIPNYARAKKRRDLTAALFSRKNVIDMQHIVQNCLEDTCANIDAHIAAAQPVDVSAAVRCCTLDVICTLCFARTVHAARAPRFAAPAVRALHAASPFLLVFKHFPLVHALTQRVPPALLVRLVPEMRGLVQVREMLQQEVRAAKAAPQRLQVAQQPTVYHALLAAEHALSDTALCDEGALFINAGTDTTGDALALCAVNVLSRADVHAKLLAELVEVWPTLEEPSPRFERLEKLVYLTAVLKESLRLAHGIVQPMTRVVPAEGAVISGQYIPGGTVVAMSNVFVHWNEELFPDAHAFRPERWLARGADLEPWLVAFSKGPRSCLGINLAWAELYMTVATLFRRYDMKLNGVGPEDIVWRDTFIPHHVGPDLTVIAKRRAK